MRPFVLMADIESDVIVVTTVVVRISAIDCPVRLYIILKILNFIKFN